MNEDKTGRAGYVAILGRPNVGKSTLLNHILGQKISITSRKPQTTRHRILGIKTEGDSQALFIDTPGMHKDSPKAINRYMNRTAVSAIEDVDVIVFVVDALKWQPDDELVLDKLKHTSCPVILVVNKVDRVSEKERLLPHLQFLAQQYTFSEIFPVSALKGDNLQELEAMIMKLLPSGNPLFDEDQITDRSERFIVAELVREKLMRQLGDEIPYELTVELEEFVREAGLITISAAILVERDSQKSIVIGNKGQRIKLIGREARLDMEEMLDSKVMLNLWVKVKRGWSDDDRALKTLGYDENS
ncbi:MAG: GTPase Era [Gammaproteobacteria bacterium]|nr:GTPase Era [Gammaproteobacteria bacterium]